MCVCSEWNLNRSDEMLLSLTFRVISRDTCLLHQLWNSVHRTSPLWTIDRLRFHAHFFQVRKLLTFVFRNLLHFLLDHLLAYYACICLSIVLKDGFAFLEVDCHESVWVLGCHLIGKVMPRSVFNQVGDAKWLVFVHFRGGCSLACIRCLPSLIHLI